MIAIKYRSPRHCAAALGLTAILALLHPPSARGQTPNVHYVEPAKPYGASAFLKTTPKGAVNTDGTLLIPLITWAADGVTVAANGGLEPNPNSALARALGRPVKLEVIDDFDEQVRNFISGKSAFLRGTADMIALVAQALKNVDPALEPVVIFQLSTSTGADGFVAKGITSLADLKGKTIVTQVNGPHLSLIGNMLKDAGLQPTDITIQYVKDITAAADYNPKLPAEDPANAFRRDPRLTGATCISPDILALTAGGTIGTGMEGTVKDARAIFTTKTASNIIFDTYAVRRDFLTAHPEMVQAFRDAHLREQEFFLGELANIEKKREADRKRVEAFKALCRPLAKIFNQDENAVSDYIIWVGSDSQLAGWAGNAKFFDDANPVGFRATTARIQDFFQSLGLIESVSKIAYNPPPAPPAAPASAAPAEAANPASVKPPAPKPAFESTQAVRKAAESADANVMYRYTFKFPAQVSEINWRDYQDVFARINETVNRYGGAIVQLRGHADNFFYDFVLAKQRQGQTTYQRRVAGTDKFETLPLPKPEEILNDANTLSYSRAFAVKQAYAAYVRENLHLGPEEVDFSRFDVKGMGIADPVIKNPTTADQRAENMRGEMVIISAEGEIPAEIGPADLK
jgi:outer membrane protein OmpA-like peptidoglycan-associated protein